MVKGNIYRFPGKFVKEYEGKVATEYIFSDDSWKLFGEIVKVFAKSRICGNGSIVIYDFWYHKSGSISFQWTDSDDSAWGAMCGHVGWLTPTQLRRLVAGLDS